MHSVKLPEFWRVVKSFSESRGGGQVFLGKQRFEMLDQKVFYLLFWVLGSRGI